MRNLFFTQIVLTLFFVKTLQLNFSDVYSLTEQFIQNRTFPGAVISVQKNGNLIWQSPVGNQTYPGDKLNIPTTNETLFDMASVSKVVACTSAVMKLYEQGQLGLKDLLIKYLPLANNHGKGQITIENLLLHNAGLPPDYPGNIPSMTKDSFIQWMIFDCAVEYPIGERFVYSDLSMIFLQLVVEKISGLNLKQFVEREIFAPMEFKFTTYQPELFFQAQNRCQPTQQDTEWRQELMRCVVQDPTAYILGGISGNAGLFSIASELNTFMQMMLNKGLYVSNGKQVRIFNESTVDKFTTKVYGLPYNNSRALGWDTNPGTVPCPCGQLFSANSFGHTGWTGPMVWADKEKNMSVVALDNRVYPQASNDNSRSNSWWRNNMMNMVVNIVQSLENDKNMESETIVNIIE